MVRASPSPLLSTRVCARIVPQRSIQKASTDHATPNYRHFRKSAKSPVPHTKGVFCSPAPSRVAVARSFERHVPTTASSNLHTIAAMRVASRVAPQCFCLRCRACEYQASNCELQVGLGVVEYGFMLQTRARNPKLRPSADWHEACIKALLAVFLQPSCVGEHEVVQGGGAGRMPPDAHAGSMVPPLPLPPSQDWGERKPRMVRVFECTVQAMIKDI